VPVYLLGEILMRLAVHTFTPDSIVRRNAEISQSQQVKCKLNRSKDRTEPNDGAIFLLKPSDALL
jgi:hypothetical protein